MRSSTVEVYLTINTPNCSHHDLQNFHATFTFLVLLVNAHILASHNIVDYEELRSLC